MDFFDNKDNLNYLIHLNHLEHGIKVTKNNIVTHKYNFGMYAKYYTKEHIYNTLKSLKYNEEQCTDIISYINTVKDPYLMFGVENNNIEVYVQTSLDSDYYFIEKIQSWDLKNNIIFHYTTIPFNCVYNIIKKNIDAKLFEYINIFLQDNAYILSKNDNNILNFYIIKKKKYIVSEIKNDIISVLKYINNDIQTIEDYLNKYLTWYLYWFRICKKINDEYEITFYFRNK
jgi:hypothetical protein